MRQNSYTAVIIEMTVRALWETQNTLDCIPDALWDREYGGVPLWQYLYQMLHRLDQWFVGPQDPAFVEPPLPEDGAPARRSRRELEEYFGTIKARLSLYLTALHDEDLLQRPERCPWTRFTLILSQYRCLHTQLGLVMGILLAETGLRPLLLTLDRQIPRPPYDPYE
ncbi:hypothetical protein [uncultured Gemmiger sp.]|uniref:hypothetical protein n=1 Tax=uncultured Gemmiger sp. TaxID=1623490 RepID=UPI002600DBA7|nr:hypothetical protein [uncultured Gemmiger sp.]